MALPPRSAARSPPSAPPTRQGYARGPLRIDRCSVHPGGSGAAFPWRGTYVSDPFAGRSAALRPPPETYVGSCPLGEQAKTVTREEVSPHELRPRARLRQRDGLRV